MNSSSEDCILQWEQLFETSKEKILSDFFDFIRFPSVSTEPKFQKEVASCSTWVQEFYRNLGFQITIFRPAEHPLILAEWHGAGPDKPTVLIYNHYDVQPADDLPLWHSPPFEPLIKDGKVYARGACDNKGQCCYVMSAIRALLERDGKLPVNLKLCIEGEEEIASPGIMKMLESNPEPFMADHFLVVDSGLVHPDQANITLGVRGILTFEITLTGSNVDLHSGVYGGIAYNPNHAMLELLASLRDQTGRIAVPKFYDNLLSISDSERHKINFDFDQANYQKQFGVTPSGGETEFSPLESAWLRPTMEVNSIHGGYFGDGFKTVIPAKAQAKISCRLVPDQDPQLLFDQICEHLKAYTPAGIKLDVQLMPGICKAARTNSDSPATKAVAQALSETFRKGCQFSLMGASIPVSVAFSQLDRGDVVIFGYSLLSDNVHAPNEHFGIDRLKKGFVTIGRTLEILGGLK